MKHFRRRCIGLQQTPGTAQAFVKWITGKDGQAILKDGNSFEYAVGQERRIQPKLVPLAQLDAPKVDASKLNSKKAVKLMTRSRMRLIVA